jgi:hypothetical protein
MNPSSRAHSTETCVTDKPPWSPKHIGRKKAGRWFYRNQYYLEYLGFGRRSKTLKGSKDAAHDALLNCRPRFRPLDDQPVPFQVQQSL